MQLTTSVVTIGFNITSYLVSEGAGSFSAIVSVLNENLEINIFVTVFTSTNSSGGRNTVHSLKDIKSQCIFISIMVHLSRQFKYVNLNQNMFRCILFYISTAQSDYTTISRSLVFNGATRSQIVTVPIRDDTVVENQFEQFFINLREYESAVILNEPTASVTIEDNDSELSMNICMCQIVSLFM